MYVFVVHDSSMHDKASLFIIQCYLYNVHFIQMVIQIGLIIFIKGS